MPNSQAQPQKRGNTNSASSPPKYQRTMNSSRTPKQSGLLLFDLPPEIIENILSFVIEVPEHPSNATFPATAVKKLFPPSAFHVNRYFRERSVNYVSQKCLWIRVKVNVKKFWMQYFEPRCRAVPTLPDVYSCLLLPSHALVNVVVNKADKNGWYNELDESLPRNQLPAANTTSLFFPFNYHSFAEVYGTLVGNRGSYNLVFINYHNIPPPLHRILQVQILPIVELIRFYAEVSITSGFDVEDVRAPRSFDSDTSGELLETIIGMVLDLDKHGRRLEASILSMYVGYHLYVLAQLGYFMPAVGFLLNRMAGPDWQSNPENEARMRQIRTIQYIESRALHAYLRGFEQYGVAFRQHAYWDHLTSIPIERVARWVTLPAYTWYGLPDHEMASHYHSLSLMFQHCCDLVEKYPDRPDMVRWTGIAESTDALGTEALYYTFCAWNLNRKNLYYASILDKYLTQNPNNMIGLRLMLNARSRKFTAVDGGQYERVGHEHLWDFNDRLKYLIRAQRVAALADVPYDTRRGDELPACESGSPNDEMVTELMFGDNNEYIVGQTPKPLRWSAVGLDDESVRSAARHGEHEVVVPWNGWTPM